MSAFAMFSLKDSSLLEFDGRRAKDSNLQQIYGLAGVPSDTQMRTILDWLPPEELKPLFKAVFEQLERGQGLAGMRYLGRYYLLSLDGTEYFASSKVHCAACLVKKKRNGEVSYRHQLVGARLSILTSR